MEQFIVSFSKRTLKENNITNWKIKISENLKSNNAALCIYESKTIEYNSHLCNYSEQFIKDIIFHEVAHVLTPKDKKHGKEWKRKFVEIGGSGCNDIDFFKESKYNVICKKCDNVINSYEKKNSIVKKILKNEIQIFCKNCKKFVIPSL